MKKRIWLVLAVALAAVLGVAAAFATCGADEAADDTADNVFLGEQDLAERMEIWRNQYRRMTPGDAPLEQDVGTWPAAWGEFSRAWDAAPAERDLATWLVPVVSERAGALTVLRDADGNALWSGATDFSKEGSESVTLTGALVSEEDWALWQAARAEIDRRLGLMREESPGGGMRGGLYTNGLRFTNIWAESNGDFRLDLAWESNGEVQVFCRAMHYEATTNTVVWTNDENEVVTNDVVDWHQVDGEKFNGTSDTWELLGVATVTNGTGSFTDSGFAEEYGRVRFYAAAALADTDGDGLTDGHEWLASHTEADNPDSDGDGVGDGAEAAMGADPADPAVSPMVTINAVLYTPADTNNLEKQWVELYSAAAETMDLAGFRLEVGQSGGWSNAVAFGSRTCIEPGRCLLVGGGQVTNADIITNALAIPQPGRTDWPTGVRLVWGGATNGNVVDTVMLGGYTNFNLDVAGWMGSTSIWTYAGKAAVRRYPGLDTDRAEDWTWAAGRTGQNSSVEIDTDGDGLPDGVEWTGSANTNVMCFGEPTNPWNADSDGDGLSDSEECLVYGTNPNTWATDGDIWPWMPEGTVVSNWPGSDFHEVLNGWDPLDPDENANGIPDSWKMAVGLANLDGVADSDGDGVDDLSEILQNSDPQDAEDSTEHAYVLHYEPSLPGWRNGTGINNCGLGGGVKVCFSGFTGGPGDKIGVAVMEGNVLEEFTVAWQGATGAETTYHENGRLALTSATPGERPTLVIQDSALHPEYVNTLGGEHTIVPLQVDVDIAGASESQEIARGGFVPVNADNDNGSAVTDGIPATRDFLADGYADDDLVEVSLSTSVQSGLGGEFRLSKLESGRGQIKIWDNAHKDNEIALPASWTVGEDNVPATLWVEGLREGARLRDSGLLFAYVRDGIIRSHDSVLLTVTPVLKALSAVADTTRPALRHDGTMQIAANNGMSAGGTSAIQFRAEVENLPGNPSGAVRLIQHAWVDNMLAGEICFLGHDGTRKKAVLNSPHASEGLVDSSPDEFPFYGLQSLGTTVDTKSDTPELGVYYPGIWPFHDGETSQVDLRSRFRLSGVWKFADGSIYFLGHVFWNTRFQGNLTNTAGRVSFVGGEANRTTGSSEFVLDNTDYRTGLPIATSCFECQEP